MFYNAATRTERQLDAGLEYLADVPDNPTLPRATGRVIIDLREVDDHEDLGRRIDAATYACPPGAEVVLFVRAGQYVPQLRHARHLGGIEIVSDDPTVVAAWISWLRSWGVAS